MAPRRWWSGRSGSGRVIAFTSTLDNDVERFSDEAPVPAARARDRALPRRSIASPTPGTPSAGCSTCRCRLRRSCARARAGDQPGRRAQAERRRHVAVRRRRSRSARAARRPSSWPSRGSIPCACRAWASASRSRWRSIWIPAESDLTPLPPAEFVATATGRAAVTTDGTVAREPRADAARTSRRNRRSGGTCSRPARRCCWSKPCWPIACRNGSASG